MSEYETFLAQSRGDMTGAKVISDQPVSTKTKHQSPERNKSA